MSQLLQNYYGGTVKNAILQCNMTSTRVLSTFEKHVISNVGPRTELYGHLY